MFFLYTEILLSFLPQTWVIIRSIKKYIWAGGYTSKDKSTLLYYLNKLELEFNIFRTFEKKMLKNSLVHVYFKDLGVTKFSKDQLFGWVDILGMNLNKYLPCLCVDLLVFGIFPKASSQGQLPKCAIYQEATS